MKNLLAVLTLFLIVAGVTMAGDILKVDFNSTNQDGGPHNMVGWEAYDAGHEVAGDFVTQTYGGITVTPDWTNTTDNRVRQMLDRTAGWDANWDNSAGDLDLVTDLIGTDTRTQNGGNGDWDGITGTPTYMTIALGGLDAGNYEWTSFHHDAEKVWGPFAAWLSTDGGVTFTQLADGLVTNSGPGSDPASQALEYGPDVYTLSSTYTTPFTANGIDDVVMRFAPYSGDGVHRQIFGMNGFIISFPTTAHEPNPSGAELVDIDADLSWKTALDIETGLTRTDVVNHILYLSAANEPNLSNVSPIIIEADGSGGASYDPGILEYYGVYTWRVDEQITDVNYITGPEWSFEVVPSDFTPTITPGSNYITWLDALPQIVDVTVDDQGEGDTLPVIWEVISGPGYAKNTDMQLINRTNLNDIANIDGDPNLLSDWIGIDSRGANNADSDVLTLTLSGLPAGTYTWKSYHYDPETNGQWGPFDVTVNDSIVPAFSYVSGQSRGIEEPNTLTVTIESDGSDVSLFFVGNDEARGIFAMNGFELTDGSSPDPLFIDFSLDDDPETSTGSSGIMPGYQGYLARHEVVDSFTSQNFAAFSTTVTITPSWDGFEGVVITSTGGTLLAPTATLEATDAPKVLGTYTLQATVTDSAAHTDSATLQIRVLEDACAAATASSGDPYNYYDRDENCVVDLSDFAAFAAQWLNDINLTAPATY